MCMLTIVQSSFTVAHLCCPPILHCHSMSQLSCISSIMAPGEQCLPTLAVHQITQTTGMSVPTWLSLYVISAACLSCLKSLSCLAEAVITGCTPTGPVNWTCCLAEQPAAHQRGKLQTVAPPGQGLRPSYTRCKRWLGGCGGKPPAYFVCGCCDTAATAAPTATITTTTTTPPPLSLPPVAELRGGAGGGACPWSTLCVGAESLPQLPGQSHESHTPQLLLTQHHTFCP